MIDALNATNLGKRYGGNWALQDCSFKLPAGRVGALVGPNGAGKTTLLHLAVGLTRPTRGTVEVLGYSPREQESILLPRVGFLAQERPLYRGFTVEEMLKMGRKLNSHWDDALARGRLKRVGVPLDRKVAKLSGGQQAQVALVITLAKRPEVLLLDEPVAALDPLARREFLSALLQATVEDGLTVLLSSHIIADLERVCDYLIILSDSRVQLTGDIEQLVNKHKLLVGPRADSAAVAGIHNVVQETHTERQTSLLVRVNGHIHDASWDIHPVPLEEIVLAYLGRHEEPLAYMAQHDEEVLV